MSGPSWAIHAITAANRAWIEENKGPFFGGADMIVSRGRIHRPMELPGFVAVRGGTPLGLATYHMDGDRCELVTLDLLERWQGGGTQLLRTVEDAARTAGAREVWLITTNDNVEALRFYQRRGYVLRAVHADAIRESRRIKPQIPKVGHFGIPIRDELELVRTLEPQDGVTRS